MGILDKIFNQRNNKKNSSLNGIDNYYNSYNFEQIKNNSCIQAINRICQEISKSNLCIVENKNGGTVKIDDTINNVLRNPNDQMTQAEFLNKMTYFLLKNSNAWVYPMYKGFKLEGLYILNPYEYDFYYDSYNELFVKLYFNSSNDTKKDILLPYKKLIHIKYNYTENEYLGGDINGTPNVDQLNESIRINDEILKSLQKGLQNPVNGVVKFNTIMDKDHAVERQIKKLEEQLEQGKSGILGLDLKGEYIGLNNNSNKKTVDKDTLEFVDQLVLRHYGVSSKILNGNYTKEEYEAFYQTVIEPILVLYSQSFTKTLLTNNNIKNKEIKVYTKDLMFLNMSETVEAIQVMASIGGFTRNEARTALGYEPLSNNDGGNDIIMSLNYINAKDAETYQVGRKE